MITSIETVYFKRKKDAKWEAGVMFNEDGAIIDEKLKPVKKPYNYERMIGVALHDLKIGGPTHHK